MLHLASDGEFDDADDVKALLSASTVRTKLLYMYFPEELLPISSKSDIDHYLAALDEPAAPSPIRGNRQLLAALRGIPELDDLSNQELGYFLYHWKNPRPSQRVVKIAPGELGKYWQDCADNSYICVGWDDVGELTQYETKEEFRDAFREHYPYNGVESQVSRKANELWTLIELQPGDTVIANKGTQEILAIGTVNDESYVWRPERQEYKHTVGIDWDTSQAKKLTKPVKGWATTTVSKVPATVLRQITGTTTNTFKPVETDENIRRTRSRPQPARPGDPVRAAGHRQDVQRQTRSGMAPRRRQRQRPGQRDAGRRRVARRPGERTGGPSIRSDQERRD